MRQSLLILLLSLLLHGEGNYMSAQTYKWLIQVQELMEKKEFNLALDALSKLENLSKKRDYDMAFVHMTFGYIYLEMEKPSFAKERFRKALELKILGVEQTLNILQNLAALHLQEEKYAEAIAYLKEWMRLSPKPSPEVHITLALAHTRLEQMPEAIREAKRAIELSAKPNEEWYSLLVSLYINVEQDAEAVGMLKKMLRLFGPKKEHLGQLYSLLMKQESYTEALAVMELAYTGGFLEKENDYKQLALLYANAQNPLAAGEVLEKGMVQGIVEKNEENYTLLYQYFFFAKESERALGYLEKASALSKKGRLAIDLGQMLFEAERYAEAAAAIKRGISKGDITNSAGVYILLGVAYYEAGEGVLALETFEKAAGYPQNKESAQSWITFLKSRL